MNQSIVLFAWIITWNYAYSPFNNRHKLNFPTTISLLSDDSTLNILTFNYFIKFRINIQGLKHQVSKLFLLSDDLTLNILNFNYLIEFRINIKIFKHQVSKLLGFENKMLRRVFSYFWLFPNPLHFILFLMRYFSKKNLVLIKLEILNFADDTEWRI